MGKGAGTVSIIGGADGPTSIFIAGKGGKVKLTTRIQNYFRKIKRNRIKKWITVNPHTLGEVVKFNGEDSPAFDEVMEVLKRHPDFEYMQMNDDSILSVPGLEIYPGRRKIYRGRKEINLTVKEYDLFYLLVVNQGHVLTYNQIYRKVWGENVLGNENNTIKCHIRNLRGKLYDLFA